MNTFLLPDLGEGLSEAEIVNWHVSVGDHVNADQPLLSVETAKAIVDVPAPVSGVVKSLHGNPGDIVQVGEILAEIDTGRGGDAGSVVGELPRQAPRAMPAVREFARSLNVDLASVDATGPEGTVTRKDVQRAYDAKATMGEPTTGEPTTGEPMRGARRSMWQNMERSRPVVAASLYDQVDVSGWWGQDGVTARLVNALAIACSAEPVLHATFDDENGVLRRNAAVDAGIAVDTAHGLLVPVLRSADTLDKAALDEQLSALIERARTRQLSPAEMKGANITLSNFGVVGGRHAALVVVPPQVAIVGAGRVFDAVLPPARGGKTAAVMPLSLTFDHRAVTGGEAARFMARFIAQLEDATS